MRLDLRSLLEPIASALVFPHYCPECGIYWPEGEGRICRSCWAKLEPAGGGLWMKKRELAGRVFVAFHYGSIARGLVHQMKFYGREDVAYLLGVEAGRGFLKWQRDLPFGAVVPVPLHPVRLRERGYDQNLSLARGVAEKLDLPVRTGLIFRNRNTRAQSRLSDVERITNLSGSFRPASTRGETVPQRVLLVDDVIHTGATVSECIQALLMTGVDDVKVLAACG